MAIKGDPSFLDPKLRRADTLAQLGRVKDAEEAFKEILLRHESCLEAKHGLEACQKKLDCAKVERGKGIYM